MSRPKRIRRVISLPNISGFKPYGVHNVKGSKKINIFLNLEEYEALRLCDFEKLNHKDASLIMDVSRPTLTRIYASARHKLAEALVNGNQLIIEGGKVYFDSEWHNCEDCGCYFNNINGTEIIHECPLCGNDNIYNCEPMNGNHSNFTPNCEIK